MLRHEAGRAAGLVAIEIPKAKESVTLETFRYRQLRLALLKQLTVNSDLIESAEAVLKIAGD